VGSFSKFVKKRCKKRGKAQERGKGLWKGKFKGRTLSLHVLKGKNPPSKGRFQYFYAEFLGKLFKRCYGKLFKNFE